MHLLLHLVVSVWLFCSVIQAAKPAKGVFEVCFTRLIPVPCHHGQTTPPNPFAAAVFCCVSLLADLPSMQAQCHARGEAARLVRSAEPEPVLVLAAAGHGATSLATHQQLTSHATALCCCTAAEEVSGGGCDEAGVCGPSGGQVVSAAAAAAAAVLGAPACQHSVINSRLTAPLLACPPDVSCLQHIRQDSQPAAV